MRKSWRTLAFATVVYLACMVVSIVPLLRWPNVASFVAGAMAATFVCVLVYAPDPFSARRLGGDAEIWTSDALRHLRREGWRVYDAIPFHRFDVDHLLAGPRGVFAVETKFTSGTVTVDERGVRGVFRRDPVAQARESAKAITSLLRAGSVEASVQPVLVLWGPGVPALEDGRLSVRNEHGGVLVLEGRTLKRHLDVFMRDQLHAGDLDAITTVIDHFVETRDAYESAK